MSRSPIAGVALKSLMLGTLSLGVVATANAQTPLKVVTSFSILDDMVSTVGGDHVAVTSLVGPNGDAHTFSPKPSDAQSLADADLVVVNGLQFEGWIDRLVEASGYEGDVVVASDGIETLAFDGEHDHGHEDHDHDHDHGDAHDHGGEHDHGDAHDHDHGGEHDHGNDHDHDHGDAHDHDHGDEHDHDHGDEHDHGDAHGHDHGDEHAHEGGHHHHHGGTDPHAWQSLANGEQYVRNIRDALVEVDPDNAEDYRDNAEAYLDEMEALDASAHERLSQIPADQRMIITSHEAFGYFADAYGLTMLAPVGLSTLAEPSASDMAELIQQINESHARALFLENMANPALINQLHEETGVAIGGELYADSLTAEGEGSTYLGMFQHNVDTLVGALQDADTQ
ncbi:metal ABC transporter solute-binding protein, Zn/Mn family [Salinicola aestuarinus]|uniref:metal ABC transporter solute-binding protein, Zn/Mn family n=1 Tax=Salinicola aestuarinus TaxID=1949082 RepID=UPI00165F09DE|nr:zinc ABC transporter substrate-binding protein [Salinicola aestuarinus]